jgi:ribosome biogenesis protein Nip4
MVEVRSAYNVLVGRTEGRRPLRRPRRRCDDNIEIDLREIGFGDVDSIHLAQDRDAWRALVNTVMNLRVT